MNILCNSWARVVLGIMLGATLCQQRAFSQVAAPAPPAEAELRLQFLDPNGKPIPDLVLTLQPPTGFGGRRGGAAPPPPLEAKTNSLGAVSFPHLPLGQRDVLQILDDRFVPLSANPRAILVTQPLTQLKPIIMVPPAFISGRILFADGTPASGIRVAFTGGNFPRTAPITDSNGGYQSGPMTPSGYRITASPTGEIAKEWITGSLEGVFVRAAEHAKAPDLILKHGALITGHITEKGTNALPTPGVPPRAGTVQMGMVTAWVKNDDESLVAFNDVNDQGAYSLRVPPGKYSLELGAPVNYVPANADRPQLTVEDTKSYTVDFQVTRKLAPADNPLSKSITGHVLDEQGNPTANIEVGNLPPADGGGGSNLWVISAADGSFELKDRIGKLEVRAYGHNHDGTASEKGLIASAGDDITIHVKAAAAPQFRGRVIDDAGNPLAGVTVFPAFEFGRYANGRGAFNLASATSQTDANGQYVVSGRWQDVRHALELSAPGYVSEDLILEPTTAEVRIVPDIIIHRTDGILEGKLLDESGKPVPKAQVLIINRNVLGTGSQPWAFSNDQGHFHIDSVGYPEMDLKVKGYQVIGNAHVKKDSTDNVLTLRPESK